MAFWGHLLYGPCLPNFNSRSLPPMYMGLLLRVAPWKSRDPSFSAGSPGPQYSLLSGIF